MFEARGALRWQAERLDGEKVAVIGKTAKRCKSESGRGGARPVRGTLRGLTGESARDLGCPAGPRCRLATAPAVAAARRTAKKKYKSGRGGADRGKVRGL